MSGEEKFFIRFKGRTLGPVVTTKLQDLVRRGQVTRQHQLSTDGRNWSPASNFDQFFPKRMVDPEPIPEAEEEDSTAPTPPLGQDWFVSIGSTPTQVSEQILRNWIAAGKVSAETLIWQEGQADWLAAGALRPEWFPMARGPQVPMQSGGGWGMQTGGNLVPCQTCGNSIAISAQVCPRCGAKRGVVNNAGSVTEAEVPHRGKSKTTAGILALLLGGLGIHKFYLGAWGWGLIYMMFLCTYIPALVAFVEAILFFTSKEEDFDRKWNLREVKAFDF